MLVFFSFGENHRKADLIIQVFDLQEADLEKGNQIRLQKTD
jgi:hypothetical protein